ncbi:DNA methyltransferase [Rufibacter quisquiliarum]|uniref:DNA modification methylase n=1 Tax=Rufibacter quisquiliarum TaxID=1549639 RepID=A0A839GI47_9BACT|nr:DNA methyltransferase [Rufibacter quisquiliarum]MBA9078300.1 DNA modification methylase [Rufibacter quisquiliarum]
MSKIEPTTDMNYTQFLESKILTVENVGFDAKDINPSLFPHQRDIVQWSLKGGRRAIFCSFGLGKSAMQLEIARQCVAYTGKSFLIGLPLGVLGEFKDDARDLIGVQVHYVTGMEEVATNAGPAIYLSNYERIRDGNFDPDFFGGVSFDEGDAIRNLDTKTSDYIIHEMSKIPLRFIATATPAPNEYTEILNYAQFLGICDRGQALTRFFQRDSTKAGNLTLYPHKEKEFWIWVRSWAIFVEHPSDLGYSDEGYDLPKLNIHYHEVKLGDRGVIMDRDNNIKMFADASRGLTESAREKRDSLSLRVEKAVEIVQAEPEKHWILWHDLEDERKHIEKILPEVKSVFGSQKNEVKEQILNEFKHGHIQHLATKPTIAGAGVNFQYHCHSAVFVGIGYKFKDFLQAIHRVLRFRQTKEVNIHLVYTDAETEVLKILEAKWSRHKEMIAEMTRLMKQYGLSQADAITELKRSMKIERKEAKGQNFTCIHNDAVEEVKTMPDNSVKMILTSIPFSDQYEYCESYRDFGHNNGNEGFFKQMDFLTPELLRITEPGRIACIHVKDRIQFSYQNGVGFTSLIDFSGQTVAHFLKHGWWLLGKHIITTDVVRENNQTYRLGWTENSKDGSKMGAGSPEYLLVFRKAPTDTSNAYADDKVVKSKEQYSRGRWQLDAHAHWNSAGNRLLSPEELRKMDLGKIYKWWESYSKSTAYKFEDHVAICETLDSMGKLPSTFMAIPPKSKSDVVWDDINRMNTLNTRQSQKKQEKHVCPLQFDIVDRAIERYSNPGDLVYDPFGGVMTVPYRCIKLGRKGMATELNEGYWRDGVEYCREAEYKATIPTLFDFLEEPISQAS